MEFLLYYQSFYQILIGPNYCSLWRLLFLATIWNREYYFAWRKYRQYSSKAPSYRVEALSFYSTVQSPDHIPPSSHGRWPIFLWPTIDPGVLIMLFDIDLWRHLTHLALYKDPQDSGKDPNLRDCALFLPGFEPVFL